jgi:hypothetical protein
MDNQAILAALKRRRLGPERAAVVEAHTLTPPPPPMTAKKQRAIQAREAARERAERQNAFVASLLPKTKPPREMKLPKYLVLKQEEPPKRKLLHDSRGRFRSTTVADLSP